MAAGNDLFKLYRYDPSMVAAVIFIILFLIISALHTYQLVRTKTWFFIPFLIGGYCKMHQLACIYMGSSTNRHPTTVQFIGYIGVRILFSFAFSYFLTPSTRERSRAARVPTGQSSLISFKHCYS